jgi:hypothetical protein
LGQTVAKAPQNPKSGQGRANFGLKNPIFGQGNGQISTSKTGIFGQSFGGASWGLLNGGQ